MRGCCYTTTQ